jgi:hypothetical protein
VAVVVVVVVVLTAVVVVKLKVAGVVAIWSEPFVLLERKLTCGLRFCDCHSKVRAPCW